MKRVLTAIFILLPLLSACSESENSNDIRNIHIMILTMKHNFPIRKDKVCLFGFTYLNNTMLLANIETV
ncbi:MAG: hypothetical protein JW822_07000 [Spirochaetales bacterium]|nr:hypothetical protein [Spirochaetales bacterium]